VRKPASSSARSYEVWRRHLPVPPCPPNEAVSNRKRDRGDGEPGCQRPNDHQLADRSSHNAEEAQRHERLRYPQVPPHAAEPVTGRMAGCQEPRRSLSIFALCSGVQAESAGY
jgi:hypothetical protein